MRLRSLLALVVSPLVLTGCGDSGTTPPAEDPIASVTVAPARDTILVGESITLQASARTAGGSGVSGATFTWSSTATAVAQVDAQGRVTAAAPGTAEIRATTSGVSGAATIVVQPRPVTSIALTASVDSLRVGQQVSVSATPFDDQGAEADVAVVWSSDDPSIARIETVSGAPGAFEPLALSTGAMITGVAPGSTVIRAIVGSVEETIDVVVEAEPVAVVEVSLPEMLRPGLGGSAAAVARTEGGAEVAGCQVTWSVGDETVATVDGDGAVAAVGAGTTDVTADADCGSAGQAFGTGSLSVDPSRVVALGTGRWFSCALVEDASQATRDLGSVYCWGANHHGQLGTGGFADRSTPARVSFAGLFGGGPADSDPARRAHEVLALGDEHACALDPDGAAWCWGDNFNGQIGDGTHTDRPTPVEVAGVPPFQALTAGEEFSCGLDFQGSVWCWGEGSDGQLGNGSTANRSTPVEVSGGLEFAMIRAKEDGVCGLTSTGATYCWGDNDSGGVGDATLVNRSIPTPVVPPAGAPAALTFSWLGTGGDMACGVEEGSGDSWCWGRNDVGQLGIGITGGFRNRPVQVAGPSAPFRVLSTSGDDDGLTVCGIQDAGDGVSGPAWCWGSNSRGQLGDGTGTSRNVPTPLATSEHFVYITSASYHSCGVTATWALMCWGGDSRGQLGNGGPISTEREPIFVPFPATAPFAGGGD